MHPIEFKEQNCVFAKDQPQYLPLPCHKTEDGEVISCWNFTFMERLKILFGKPLWLSMLTFNSPLQPQRPSIDYPFNEQENDSTIETSRS
jgi:hypothetical protein